MTVRSRVLKAAAGTSYSRVVLILSQLLSVPLLVLRWGPATYGAWIALTALTSYLAYSAVGLAPALRSDMALHFHTSGEKGLRTTFQTSLFTIVLLTGAACAAFVWSMFNLPITQWLHLSTLSVADTRQIATAIAIQVILSMIFGVVAAALSAVGDFGLSQSVDATRVLIELMLLFVLVGVFRWSPADMAVIYPLTSAAALEVAIMILISRAPWLFAKLDLNVAIFRRLMRPMLGAVLMSFGYTGLSVQAPRLIIAATLGPAAVATFTLAGMMLRIARIPIEIPAFAATVEMSLAYGRGDLPGTRSLLLTSTRFTLWLALTILPFVVGLGALAAFVWSGSRIHVPTPMLAILALATVAYSIGLPSQELLMALNRLGLASVWLGVFALPFMGLCYFGCRAFGLLGAAGALLLLELVFATSTVFMAAGSLQIRLAPYFRALASPPVRDIRVTLQELIVARLPRTQSGRA